VEVTFVSDLYGKDVQIKCTRYQIQA